MVDGLKISSCLRKTFACVFKNVLFLSIAILDLDLAFLGTRSWYTDEVALFVHVSDTPTPYLLARLLCTSHCAGPLGCSGGKTKLIPIL